MIRLLTAAFLAGFVAAGAPAAAGPPPDDALPLSETSA